MKSLIFKKHLNLKFIIRMVTWHLSYYFLGRGTPITAGVYINDICNYHCIMCDIRMKEKPVIYPREAQERDIDALSNNKVVPKKNHDLSNIKTICVKLNIRFPIRPMPNKLVSEQIFLIKNKKM